MDNRCRDSFFVFELLSGLGPFFLVLNTCIQHKRLTPEVIAVITMLFTTDHIR